MEKRHARAKFWLFGLAALGVVGTACYLFRGELLPVPARLLVVRDVLQPSDVIYVLNGDPNLRPFYAAQLYHQNRAPLVAIARAADSPMVRLGLYPNTTDMCTAVLRKLGVPESNIVELKSPNGVTSTFDEAQLLRAYTHQHRSRRVIIVTSAFHTRRASWIFRRVLQSEPTQLAMAPVEDPKYSASNWWTKEDGQVACNDEYVKLFWYFLRYGFQPLS